MKAGTSSIFALHASFEEAERASSYASRHQERAGAPDLVADRWIENETVFWFDVCVLSRDLSDWSSGRKSICISKTSCSLALLPSYVAQF
jgi:hypothetical protein